MDGDLYRVWRDGRTIVERVDGGHTDELREGVLRRDDKGRPVGIGAWRVHHVARRVEVTPEGEPVDMLDEPMPRPSPVPAGLKGVDVERWLVWAVQQQKVYAGDVALDAAAIGPLKETGDDEDVLRSAAHGLRVYREHPDAIAARAAIASLGRTARALVVRHARRGDRPAVPERVRFAPLLTRAGNPQVQWDTSWDRHRNYGWVPVVMRPSPAEIEAARRDYVTWRIGLFDVARSVRRRHQAGQRCREWWPLDPLVPPLGIGASQEAVL